MTDAPQGTTRHGDSKRGAFMSSDSDGFGGGPLYRYEFWRWWGEGSGSCLWVMLNPSTADHERDDPTMKRVIHFSKAWGYGGCMVVNLFALRSPSPAVLAKAADPVGPMNSVFVSLALATSAATVAAWGATKFAARADDMKRQLLAAGRPILCLDTSKNGSPKHPLARGKERVPDSQQPATWRAPR